MSRFETPGCSRFVNRAQTRGVLPRGVLAGGALALVVQLGFWVGTAGGAFAQSAPVITNNPSVIVDLGVLEALGGGPVTLGAPALAIDPGQRGPIATSPLTRPAAPARQAPSAAPRSRLNANALAALGVNNVAPPPPAAVPARQPVAAAPQRRPVTEPTPVPRTTAAAPPPPPPVAAPATAPARSVAAARPETTVPPPPVLPDARTAGTAPAVSPPPVAAPAVSPPPETQTASVAPTVATEAPAGGALSIAFNEGSAVLPDDARGKLDDLVAALTGDPALKVQLRAFAAGTADTTSQARRLSLSRALAVRSFLIENGVQTTRMDVRALGNKSGDGPADRVDVVMVDQ